MTDSELTEWEHRDNVISVLITKEMGAWLHRRDKRVLVVELEKVKKKLILKLSEKFDFGITEALNILDEELSELKGEQE